MNAAEHDTCTTKVQCLTCCQPFILSLADLLAPIACPHCGAHYLPLGRALHEEPAGMQRPWPATDRVEC